MDTLSRQITRRFFRTDDGHQQLRRRWTSLIAEDRRRAAFARRALKLHSGIDPAEIEPQMLRSEHHLLYAVLRGTDWRKGFSPCADQRRLDNGYARWASATRAILALHSNCREEELITPFVDLLASDALPMIRPFVPKGEGYFWQANLDMPAYSDEALSHEVSESGKSAKEIQIARALRET